MGTRRERRRLPLETETSWFILANVMDVIVTWRLLVQGQFMESNPIARYFLNHWGVAGMNYFKFSVVAVVAVIAQVVYTQRPTVARWLLIGATCVVSSVVLYSVSLFFRMR
ncbi:MAG: DUF5658 family protein [Planctomycetaceae bacterium]